jgi:hypothetical protein
LDELVGLLIDEKCREVSQDQRPSEGRELAQHQELPSMKNLVMKNSSDS